MRLISYHIENYGKIHNADGVFNGGLTEFCEKNGFGKTTLASFIRAMFYGLPTYTTRTKTFDDRQHFYPFEGGKFGGNITFEMQGKTYKIERFFDKKSAKDDELKVYCDGAPYMGFGEDIGREVFGLDEESFKKTVFITAEEIEIESTHSINEKLNRDVEGGEDNDFEAAISALEKAKKELKAARGANDLISQTKNETLILNDRIKNLRDMSDTLTEEYVTRERLTKEIAVCEYTLKQASERALLLQKWETLDNLTAQAEQKTAMLRAYEVKYPHGVPSAEERKLLGDCVQEENRLTGSLQSASFGEDKERQLAILQEKFKNGAPMDEDIAKKQQSLTRLATLVSEIDTLQNTPQTPREKELEKRFAERVPDENTLAQKRQVAEEYKREDAQLKELHASLVTSTPIQKTGNKNLTFLFGAIAVVMLAVGAWLLAETAYALGGVLMGLGALVLTAGLVVMKKPTATVNPTSDVTVKIAALQAELRMAEETLRAFTVPYGYYSDAGVLYDFATLEEDVRAYCAQVQTAQGMQERIARLTQEADGIATEVKEFLQAYGEYGENLQNGLNRLLSSSSNYTALQADKASAHGRANDVQMRILQCKATILEIVKKYGLNENAGTMDGLKGLEMDCRSQDDLIKEVTALEENLKNYQAKNGLTERPAGAVENTEGLHASLSGMRKQLADCDKRITEIEREVEKLPDIECELERAEEKLKEYKERHTLLTDTIDALKEAEKALKDRYIAPIKEKFSFYAEALERVLDEKITMDSDYRVKFERGGEERSDRHLSAGERSLCALCLRLALIDNLYESEQPFIVMDDPFVHLDKTHMGRTAELLNALSENRQIIYFCCHDSRSTVVKQEN